LSVVAGLLVFRLDILLESEAGVTGSSWSAWRIDMAKAPLIFTYYIAAPVEKVWDGFVSKEANQKIFTGADFELHLKPGGAMTWSGTEQGWEADAVCDG
jgi:hypothetical protein